MPDGPESTAARRAPEEGDDFTNRKLIRPSLPRENARAEHPRSEPALTRGGNGYRRSANADQTHAENFYYQKQMQAKTPMTFVLKDGEQVHGVIEWYDRDSIKIHRGGGSALLLYKQGIRYIYKTSEER